LPDDGDIACSFDGVNREGGVGLDLSDSSSRI